MINSMFFRLLSMGAKFLFLFISASKLSANDIALYGGINSLLILSVYFLAADLYIETTRRLIDNNKKLFNIYFSNQVVFIFVFFIIYTVVFYFIDAHHMENKYLFILLVLFELIAQELYRFLIAVGKYKNANVLFFIKSGLWCFISSFLIYTNVVHDFKYIMYLWIISVFFSILYGFCYIHIFLKDIKFLVSLTKFLSSFKRNMLIFSSSISLLSLNNLDKLFVSTSSNKTIAAAYIFYSSIVGSVLTIIYSGIINPYYKSIVQSRGEWKIIKRVLIKIASGGIGISAIVCLFILLFKNSMLNLINKEYFVDNIDILYLLMVNMLISVLALVPHYFLFANQKDKIISCISVSTVIVQVTSMYFLNSIIGVYGIIYSVIISTLFMFIAKLAISIYLKLKYEY